MQAGALGHYLLSSSRMELINVGLSNKAQYPRDELAISPYLLHAVLLFETVNERVCLNVYVCM